MPTGQTEQPPPPPPPQQQPPPPPPQQQPQQQLAPPPPIEQQPPPPQSTEQRLDDSKKQDSGCGLEFLYLNAQAGAAFDALGTFSNTLQLQNTKGGGAMVGAEVGVRFVWFTLGARFRYEMLQPFSPLFNLWELDAVAGFHIPAGSWDPYVTIHGGYAAIGSVDPNNVPGAITMVGNTAVQGSSGLSTSGANVGFSVGADYYMARFLSIGIEGSFEVIFLHRPPLTPPTVDGVACSQVPQCASQLAANPIYQDSGDAAGIGLVGSAHLALHL